MEKDVDYDTWWKTIGKNKPDVVHWVDTFKEREKVLRDAFGPTYPPNRVVAFSWNNPAIHVPGACALTFSPRPPARSHWLTITHGLTQQKFGETAMDRSTLSGYGAEFGICTDNRHDWCIGLLKQLITYTQLGGTHIARGSRLPCFFLRDKLGKVYPRVKLIAPSDPAPVNEIRCLLFWPYTACPRTFSTSTGSFEVLIGTAITEEEWELAKQTSSIHVLLLLFVSGIGQVSRINRQSITDEQRWANDWRRIAALRQQDAEDELVRFCATSAMSDNQPEGGKLWGNPSSGESSGDSIHNA